MATQTFDRQDPEYRAWRDAHQADGFVVNSLRPPNASYIRLHRASCFVLAGEPANGVAWTNHYIKTVSNRQADLEEWASKTFPGGTLSDCARCMD